MKKFVSMKVVFYVTLMIISLMVLVSCNNNNNNQTDDPTEKECNHNWVEDEAARIESTCNTYGVITYRCSICNEEKKESMKTLGAHSYINNFCSVCGKRKEGDFEVQMGSVKAYLYRQTGIDFALEIEGNGAMKDYSSASDSDLRKLINKEGIAIKTIKIFEGVTTIGDYAFTDFAECLNVFELPSTLTKIGKHAFERCSLIESVSLPKNVTEIGDYAYNGCSKIKAIMISSNKCDIGFNAFNDCPYVTSLSMPMNDKIIPSKDDPKSYFGYMFGYQEYTESNVGQYSQTMYDKNIYFNVPVILTEIEIFGDADIPDYYFYSCKYLQKITINDNSTLKKFGKYSFAEMPTLFHVDLENNSLESIGKYAFKNSYKLVEFIATENVNEIGEGAFFGCSDLSKFEFLGNGVVTINRETFKNCISLESFYTGSVCTTIGSDAFKYCSKLKEFHIGIAVNSITNGALPDKMYITDKLIIDSSVIANENTDYFNIFGGTKYIYVLKSIKLEENAYFKTKYTKDKNLSSRNADYDIYYIPD